VSISKRQKNAVRDFVDFGRRDYGFRNSSDSMAELFDCYVRIWALVVQIFSMSS